jgi:hypothetical protein
MTAIFVSQELEINYPTAAWLMLHKIRKVMADHNEGYKPSGLVEIDDFYIGARLRTASADAEPIKTK